MVNVSQKTILLVEDEMIIATIEMAQLQKEGYKVIHTPTGEEAIEMVKFSPIDLILMDIDLGSGIDGTQTAEEILKSYDIPIVFLSSRTEKEIVQKTEKITSYGYVVKNSGIIVIDASIKMAFKLHEANKNIKKEKEQLRTILQSIGDAVIATDKNGVILQMNTIAEILTGWSVSEARGRHLIESFKIYNRFTKEPHPDPVSNALTENNIIYLRNHTCLKSKDGKEYQISDSSSPIRDSYGNVSGVVIVFRDVSKEYEIQKIIENSDKKYKSIIDISPIPYAVNDNKQNIVLLNKAFTQTFGYTLGDIPTLSDWWPKAYPDPIYRQWVAETWQARVEKSIKENSNFVPMEIVIRCKNGTNRTIMATAATLDESDAGLHLVILYDITDRKKIELELKRSSDLLEESQSIAKVGGWELDLITGTLYWTKETYILHDTNPDEFNPTVDAGIQYYLPSSRDILEKALKDAIEKGIGYDLELELLTIKNRKIFVRTTCVTTVHENKTVKLTGIFQDISDRKKADEKIQNLLIEKDTILKEVHHRIKNNMTTLYSLLSIQSLQSEDQSFKNLLQDSASRVRSMMVLYDTLYRSEKTQSMSIKKYLPILMQQIIEIFPSQKKVKIESEIDDIELQAQSLTPLGIFINELITNTIKYAFPNRDSGLIRVTAQKKNNEVEIIYSDDGIGISPSIQINNPQGFGLQLINLLARQLNGSVSIEPSDGAKFVLRFKI